MMSMIISKKRARVMEEMENSVCGCRISISIPFSLSLFQEKDKSLYEDLKKKHGKESDDTSFNASHDWFHQFKAREK